MNIRHATLFDIDEINAIYNYEVVNSYSTFDTQIRTHAQAVNWFNQHSDSNHPIFVYECENRALAYCSLSKYRDFDAFSSTVEISIYVNHEYRQQKIATKLVERAIEYASSCSEIRNIVAVITSINDKSIKLFSKLNFINAGTIEEAGVKNGKVLGITNMYKLV